MDRDVIRARFEQIKERARRKVDEEIRRERGDPGVVDPATLARWPRRGPRPVSGNRRPRRQPAATSEAA